MKVLYFFSILFMFLGSCLIGQDTFSIIAVDPDTKEIGAAGATCVDDIGQVGGIKILNKIIPGRGGVNAQAWICINPHINLDIAIQELRNGLSPEELVDFMQMNDQCSAQNFNPEFRQYGFVDFDADGNPRAAAFTGSSADDYKNHITGPNYAIQGNILLGPEVLEGMEAGFNSVDGPLHAKLMAAMQGANFPGADKRCLDRGTSSTSAFLKVAKPTDIEGSPSLLLDVMEVSEGEEPIDELQSLYDAFIMTSAVEELSIGSLRLVPNPVKDHLNLQSEMTITDIRLMTMSGESMKVADRIQGEHLYDCSHLPTGLYSIVYNEGGFNKYTKFTKL